MKSLLASNRFNVPSTDPTILSEATGSVVYMASEYLTHSGEKKVCIQKFEI